MSGELNKKAGCGPSKSSYGPGFGKPDVPALFYE